MIQATFGTLYTTIEMKFTLVVLVFAAVAYGQFNRHRFIV
jgi:hypothetical protein